MLWSGQLNIFQSYGMFLLQSNSFYALYPDGQFGSTSYMAKAVVNRMLQEGLHYDPSSACVLSWQFTCMYGNLFSVYMFRVICVYIEVLSV